MKNLVEELGNYVYKHVEESAGVTVGVGLGVKHIAQTQTENIYLQVAIVVILAFVGGVAGALGKWTVEAFRNKKDKQ